MKCAFVAVLCAVSAYSSVVITSDLHEYQVLPMSTVKGSMNGCSLTGSLSGLDKNKKWLGLIRKGGCPVLTKYNVLKEMGASGMIILNGGGVEYTANDSFHVISIQPEMYQTLLKMYESTQKYPSVKIVHASRTGMPLVQILYIVFLILMIFVFPSLFERLDEPLVKIVQPKELSTVSIKPFGEIQEKDIKYEECPICFEKFKKDHFIRILQCSHYYHGNCIDPWLLSRSCRCPVCNHELSFT